MRLSGKRPGTGLAVALAAVSCFVPTAFGHPGHGSHGGSVVTPKIIPRSQEPSAQVEKRAPTTAIGNPYGLFRFGHFNGTYFHEEQDNHIKSTDVKVSAGLTLGTKLLADALDLSANLGFERTDDNSDIKTLQPALVARWRMVQQAWGVLSSALIYEGEMDEDIAEGTLSVSYGTPTYRYENVSLFSGLSLSYIKPMQTKTFQAEIIDELSSGSDIRTMPVGKSDPSTSVLAIVGANYKPRFVKGLTLRSQLDFLTDYEPYFRVRTDLNGAIAETQKDTVATKSSEAKLGASYQLTKRAVLSSDLVFRATGFFERPRSGDDSDDNRFENLTAITVTLF